LEQKPDKLPIFENLPGHLDRGQKEDVSSETQTYGNPILYPNSVAHAEHVSKVLTSCSSLLYALRILRTHGMTATSLYDVFRATIVSKLLYCSPAWSGFCSAADIARLDAFLKRRKRFGIALTIFSK